MAFVWSGRRSVPSVRLGLDVSQGKFIDLQSDFECNCSLHFEEDVSLVCPNYGIGVQWEVFTIHHATWSITPFFVLYAMRCAVLLVKKEPDFKTISRSPLEKQSCQPFSLWLHSYHHMYSSLPDAP